MKRKPKPSKLDRLFRSHMRLLRLVRGQIVEIGELRKLILKTREQGMWRWNDEIRNEWREVQRRANATPPNDWPRL